MTNQSVSDALANNYLLVDLQLRSWSGKRTDKDASSELLTAKNATRDGGAFVKNLLASAGQELKEVHQMGNALRTFLYNNTLPWSASDGAKRGLRLLATTKAMDFLTELNSLKREYDRAVIALVTAWPQRCAEAQHNLGALADASDYPSATALPQLFGVTVDLKPIPAAQDFTRLNVPAELATALAERAKGFEETCRQNAMTDLRDRFIEELQRMHTQLAKAAGGEKTRLYDSLVTNLKVLTDMARNMNLNGNPKLDDLVGRIESQLLAYPVEAYKTNQSAASVVADGAKRMAIEAMAEDLWN